MRILPTMQEYKQNGILRKQIFRTILLVLVNGSCFGFVIWQTISCTQKYINKPQMTKVSLKDSSELPSSPDITICGSFGSPGEDDEIRFNKTHLEDICGIK